MCRPILEPCEAGPSRTAPVEPGSSCDEQGIRLGQPCNTLGQECVYVPEKVERGCYSPTTYLKCLPPLYSPGCPSSTASSKKDIQYLTPLEVSEAAREIRDLPLVRYRYKSQADGVTPTVGIVIEDVPGASFVDRENQRVNLYSFVSATAAAYQAQAKELEALKAGPAGGSVRADGRQRGRKVIAEGEEEAPVDVEAHARWLKTGEGVQPDGGTSPPSQGN